MFYIVLALGFSLVIHTISVIFGNFKRYSPDGKI